MANARTKPKPTPTAKPEAAAPQRKPIEWGSLTLGEVDKLETLAGQPVTALTDENAPKGRLLAAMVFVASRRYAEPKTWDECLAMTPDEATAYTGMDQADEDQAEGDDTPGN